MKTNLFKKSTVSFLLLVFLSGSLQGCAYTKVPYKGVNPENPQFVRGTPCPPLDFLGDMLSKPYQLLFWTSKYGNHRISVETEKAIQEFFQNYQIKDVKVRINQWAPHKDIARLFTNKNIAWPYRILFFPSTLISSLLGRPLGGFVLSDFYDPGSNTVHIYSDSKAIALHEAGHAYDFSKQEYKGTYALARMVPGVNLVQEALATDDALTYMEEKQQYDDLFKSYKVLYPAYTTYIMSYIPVAAPALIGAIIIGHIVGRSKASEKEWQLRTEGKYPVSVTAPAAVVAKS